VELLFSKDIYGDTSIYKDLTVKCPEFVNSHLKHHVVLLIEHPSIVCKGESIYLRESPITSVENLCIEAFVIEPKQLKLVFLVQWYKGMDIVELTENYQAKCPPKTKCSLHYLL
jgi:hypothetical protein